MYKLNAAKFYKWIWGTEVTTFKTMCPYFWKYTLTILFLPLILIGKLLFYLMPAKKKVAKTMDYIADSKVGTTTGKVVRSIGKQDRFWDVILKILKWTYFIVIGGLILVMVIGLSYKFFTNLMLGFAIIGMICTVIAVIFITVELFGKYQLRRKIAAPFKLFGNMISSLYHNMCPLINWN